VIGRCWFLLPLAALASFYYSLLKKIPKDTKRYLFIPNVSERAERKEVDPYIVTNIMRVDR